MRGLGQVLTAGAEVVKLFREPPEKDTGGENRLRLQQKNLKKRRDSRRFLAGDETPVGLDSQPAVGREWLCCLYHCVRCGGTKTQGNKRGGREENPGLSFFFT